MPVEPVSRLADFIDFTLWSPRVAGSEFRNRSRGCKVRFASNHLIVSVYRVPQMQGVGHADVLLYFKCPTTKQMRCPVNAYSGSVDAAAIGAQQSFPVFFQVVQ